MRFCKKYIFLFILILAYTAAFSQQEDISNNINSSGRNSQNIIITQNSGFNYWDEKFKGNWSGIYMGFNGFANSDYSDYSEGVNGFLDNELFRSNSININLLQGSFGLQHNRNTIGIVTGLGMEINTYYLKRSISIEKQTNRIEPVKLYFDDNQKSKLSSAYINIPLLFEFQVPVNNYGNRFHMAAGLTAKVRIYSYTKIKYRQDSEKVKQKTPDSYYINDISYAATLYIGYGRINLYATYDLQPLFKENKGPVVYPYSLGIALLSF